MLSSQVVSPILADYGVDMPPECPMHPTMDMYSAQVRELQYSLQSQCSASGEQGTAAGHHAVNAV